MTRTTPLHFALMIAAITVALAPRSASLQEVATPEIELEPETGPVGTSVTIHGNNAPPHATVTVLWVPWETGNPCEPPPMGAFLVEEVVADAEGRFTATHHADIVPVDPDVQFDGVTYFAKTHELQSDFVCFSYAEEHAQSLSEIGLGTHTASWARLDWDASSRPTRYDVLLGF